MPAGHVPPFCYGILTLSDRAFQLVRINRSCRSTDLTTPPSLAKGRFGLLPVRSPLLRESRLISFRRGTEMFQVPRCPPACLWIQQGVSRHHSGWVAPFGYSGFLAWMQLPLNVSPVSASFIGFKRRGIHLVLCVAC